MLFDIMSYHFIASKILDCVVSYSTVSVDVVPLPSEVKPRCRSHHRRIHFGQLGFKLLNLEIIAM